MPVTINVTAETSALVLDELYRMFGPRVFADTPALAEKRAEVVEAAQKAEPAPAPETPAETQKRTRRTKAEMEAAKAAEIAAATPVVDPRQIDIEEAIAATKASTAAAAVQKTEPTKAVDVPSIEDLRAALKRLGAADGFGHDKVFEVLKKYDAKSASGLPEEKRAEVIEAINTMLEAE